MCIDTCTTEVVLPHFQSTYVMQPPVLNFVIVTFSSPSCLLLQSYPLSCYVRDRPPIGQACLNALDTTNTSSEAVCRFQYCFCLSARLVASDRLSFIVTCSPKCCRSHQTWTDYCPRIPTSCWHRGLRQLGGLEILQMSKTGWSGTRGLKSRRGGACK